MNTTAQPKSALLFDFVADKQQNTITVRREFAGKRQLVWDCHTKSELLEQWFAPRPLTAKTKHMSFKPGGYWHYAMVDPDGKEYWGRADYQTISPIDGYTTLDAFSDENGAINPDLPRASWKVTFTEQGNHTVVETVVTYHSLADLEKVLNMGMKEGLAATLERLDDLLATLSK